MVSKQDREANICGGRGSGAWTDYKLFADAFYQNHTPITAQTSAASHVNRLRGLGSLRESVWPAQLCHGWFIGDDTGYQIPAALRNSLLQERTRIDGDGGYTVMVGIKRMANIEDPAELRSKHDVSAGVLSSSPALSSTPTYRARPRFPAPKRKLVGNGPSSTRTWRSICLI